MRASVGVGGARRGPGSGAELAADEQRLQHHLVPGFLGELLARVGVAVGHRLEHRRACWCAMPSRGRASRSGLAGIERQAAIEGDQLADVGGLAQAESKRAGEGGLVAVVAGEQEGEAGRLVEAPAGRVPARPGACAAARSASSSARSALPSRRGDEAQRDDEVALRGLAGERGERARRASWAASGSGLAPEPGGEESVTASWRSKCRGPAALPPPGAPSSWSALAGDRPDHAGLGHGVERRGHREVGVHLAIVDDVHGPAVVG